MGTDKPDEHDSVLVPDSCYQSVIVAFDVEDNPVVCNEAGIAIDVLDVLRPFPCRMFDIIMPCLKRLSRIRMLLPKFSQSFVGYDSHRETVYPAPIMGATKKQQFGEETLTCLLPVPPEGSNAVRHRQFIMRNLTESRESLDIRFDFGWSSGLS